ncbi:MAG: cation:proton antiporter [Streptosporangiaceae bacterium]|nr:cation:proton antiporter [Streptosporangiaceae bacterium]
MESFAEVVMTEHIAVTAGLAIGAIIALSAALTPLCRMLRQPVVVGQLVAGAGLGMLPRSITGAVFPAASLPFLNVISQIGLALFLFRVGYEIDLRSRRDYRRGIFAVAVGGFVPSMLLGVGLAALLGGTSRWAPLPGVPRGSFVLFIAVAMSITAVPVLACILAEHDIVTTRPGIVAMSSAGMLDVAGWLLLTVAISAAGMKVSPASVAIGLLGYVAGMLFVARPALRRLMLAAGPARILPETAVIPFVLVSAWCTARLGLHPFSGALLAGMVMPRNANGGPDAGLVTTVEKTSSILLPVFFVVTGMALRAGALRGPDLGLLAVVCVLATAGKLGGSTLAARASRMAWRDSLTVGVLMNTRGLTELIAINAGRQAGLIGTSLYTILVLMALVTTALTGPLLALLRTQKFNIMYLERHEILTPWAEKSKSLQFPAHHGTLKVNAS